MFPPPSSCCMRVKAERVDPRRRWFTSYRPPPRAEAGGRLSYSRPQRGSHQIRTCTNPLVLWNPDQKTVIILRSSVLICSDAYFTGILMPSGWAVGQDPTRHWSGLRSAGQSGVKGRCWSERAQPWSREVLKLADLLWPDGLALTHRWTPVIRPFGLEASIPHLRAASKRYRVDVGKGDVGGIVEGSC